MTIDFKYNIGDKVYYLWNANKIIENKKIEIYEGEIQGLSIRKGYKGELIKTVDFKGINGVLEGHVATNKDDLEQPIQELINNLFNLKQ